MEKIVQIKLDRDYFEDIKILYIEKNRKIPSNIELSIEALEMLRKNLQSQPEKAKAV